MGLVWLHCASERIFGLEVVNYFRADNMMIRILLNPVVGLLNDDSGVIEANASGNDFA